MAGLPIGTLKAKELSTAEKAYSVSKERFRDLPIQVGQDSNLLFLKLLELFFKLKEEELISSLSSKITMK